MFQATFFRLSMGYEGMNHVRNVVVVWWLHGHIIPLCYTYCEKTTQKKTGNDLIDSSSHNNNHKGERKHRNSKNTQDTRVAGLPFISHFPVD